MARLIWTESAVYDLKAIAEYIELDKPLAARQFVKKVLASVSKLEKFPQLGKVPEELQEFSYRELVVPPCRIFYRVEKNTVYVVAVMRGEKAVEAEKLLTRL